MIAGSKGETSEQSQAHDAMLGTLCMYLTLSPALPIERTEGQTCLLSAGS